MKRNFLEETKDELNGNGKTLDDIKWVGTKYGDYVLTVEEFIKMADFEYRGEDEFTLDYMSEVVKTDLVIVGDNWWLERDEYIICDRKGEYWAFKTLPKKSKNYKKLSTLLEEQL